MLNLRPYQEEAVSSVWEYMRTHEDNPCIVLPTASGKSIVIAKIAMDAVKNWNGRVLILAHVKELLEQNAGKIKNLCDVPIGVFSAGLQSHDTDEAIIVAGIQSVYNKIEKIGTFDIVIIDEAHTVPVDGDGQYRTLLSALKEKAPHVRIIGLTATPFRLKGGLICKPENILNTVCYEIDVKWMIQHGYISKLITKAGKAEADLKHLHVRGGEFLSEEISAAMNKDEITDSACREIVDLTKNRKSVLIFGSSLDHCRNIKEKIEKYSKNECALVDGETPFEERAEILERFRGGLVKDDFFGNFKPPLKFVVNMNVLTTGFDAPNIDCVVLLRPTASPGLMVQMIGRGFRLSPDTGKDNCLVLDYGENIIRHGPVDMIRVRDKTSGHGDAPAKKCPECNSLIFSGYRKCPDCGYEFPAGAVCRITDKHSKECIISGEVFTEELDVLRTDYSVHKKRNASDFVPETMRITYKINAFRFESEWVCPEHTGYARDKFEKWWKKRTDAPLPKTAADAVKLAQEGWLAEAKKITVKSVAGDKFVKITNVILGEKPCYMEPGCDLATELEYRSNSPQDIGVHEDDIPF